MAQEFIRVAQASEVQPGQMKLVEYRGERVLLVNLNGTFHAVGEVCPHAGGPLSEGVLEGEGVECPLHGSVFNAKSGAVETPPANEDLPVYRVRVEGGHVLIAQP